MVSVLYRQKTVSIPRERALAKNWWRGCVATLVPFSWLSLTQWPPFLIICNQFLTISHQITPFFDMSSKFSFFFQNFCPKFGKICLILTVWCPPWFLLTLTPFYRKNLSPKALYLRVAVRAPLSLQKLSAPPVSIPRCNPVSDSKAWYCMCYLCSR